MTTFDPDAYVIRNVTATPSGRSSYLLVDMAGRLARVTVARNLIESTGLDRILRAALAARRPWVRS